MVQAISVEVSILVLMDVALEPSFTDFPSDACLVSILVLMDVALELQPPHTNHIEIDFGIYKRLGDALN